METIITSEVDKSSNSIASTNNIMIALYYWYIDIPTNTMQDHKRSHTLLCQKYNLYGRIRISPEGLNGVLSGRRIDLESYEQELRAEVMAISSPVIIKTSSSSRENDSSEIDTTSINSNDEPIYGKTLDVKYCHLRNDVPVEKQIFDSLSVKITQEVVSLNENGIVEQCTSHKKKRRNKRQNKPKNTLECDDVVTTIIEEKTQTNNFSISDNSNQQNKVEAISSSLHNLDIELQHYVPAPHLSPKEWNDRLLSCSSREKESITNDLNGSNVNLLSDTESPNDDAILIDVRNVYESRIGHFSVKGVPTLLTNTRKYASLPAVLDASIEHLAGKNIFMYCTGGVRCERASVYLQAMAESSLWPKDLEKPKGIYQLEGGIQKYLEEYGSMDILSDDNDIDDDDSEMRNQDANIRHNCNNDDNSESQVSKKEQGEQDSEKKCLFKGKNFVFDPRRFDPVVGKGGKAGECVICACPHDDYDNGFAPSENKEARCCRCRVLVLICNNCRKSIRTWGEEDEEENTEETVKMKKKEDLFCGPSGKECIDEGNRVNHYQIV